MNSILMRIQKYNILVSGIICILSFIVALLFNTLSIGFWSNVFIGLFSSASLVLFLSIASYRVERRRTLEAFYTSVVSVINNLNKYEKNEDPEKTMELVLDMNQFNYADFDLLFGDIDFLLYNKMKREYIYKQIYEKINKIRNILKEKSFHFNEYKKTDTGNLAVMKILIKEIDNEIMDRTEEDVINSSGDKTKLSFSYNKLTEELSNELNGKFYELMYSDFKTFKPRL
ncbi:hypothetical protein [Paenibacillus alkalitolerans]|uniref:hypothetical protein n=1 Tax=Paenibacillus alkalitolerans TaxID=2799335 RepID=UPI0018F6FC3C|nr:hypothetical protein [Paenibacillus alkalitolerans]